MIRSYALYININIKLYVAAIIYNISPNRMVVVVVALKPRNLIYIYVSRIYVKRTVLHVAAGHHISEITAGPHIL